MSSKIELTSVLLVPNYGAVANPEEPSTPSCSRRFWNRITSFGNAAYRAIHHPITSSVMVVASICGIVALKVFSNRHDGLNTAAVTTLGYFGQTVADQAAKSARPAVERIIRTGSWIKRNVSYEALTFTNVMRVVDTSITVGSVFCLLGMSLRDAMRSCVEGEEGEVGDLEPIELSRKRDILVGGIAAASIFAGMTSLLSTQRVLNWETILLELGIRAGSGIIGCRLESSLYRQKLDNHSWQWPWKALKRLPKPLLALSIYFHNKAATSGAAAAWMIPWGFSVGANRSQQQRLFNHLDSVDIANDPHQEEGWQRNAWKATRVVCTLASLGAGTYLLARNILQPTLNYVSWNSEVGIFFAMPTVFFLTRFVEHGNAPLTQEARFLLHYCPLELTSTTFYCASLGESTQLQQTARQTFALAIMAKTLYAASYASYRRATNKLEEENKTNTVQRREYFQSSVVMRYILGEALIPSAR